MKPRTIRFGAILAGCGLTGLLVWLVLSVPHHPVALLRVVDVAGKPIAGAVIHPEGLRTKSGPYRSGWYSWQPEKNGVPNNPVTSDTQGYARVPYPKYVLEHLETGVLCLSVEDARFVPDRPEVDVNFAPPAGAPWRAWGEYILARLQHKGPVTQTVPIVLNQGATLLLSVKPGTPWVTNAPLFAQISGLITAEDTNFWNRPAAGVLVTHCLRPGREVVRVIQFDPNPKGPTWFSPAMVINAVAGKTNEVPVELTPGVSVHGKLDEIVPRPVRNGRVIARVSPAHEQSQNSPPDWHTWTKVADDGTFEIESLPTGELELVAICDGFVNTNGPGQFTNSMHYPQKFLLETNELEVMLGMEPTAVLEVMVKDNSGKPLKDATVSTWPNVRYGEWSATILGQDCYHTADSLRDAQGTRALRKWWFSRPPAFQATTDVSGVAVILNLPREANVFDVGHARFSMPAKDGGSGQKTRQASMSLRPGQTNHATVQLVPAEGDQPIAHY